MWQCSCQCGKRNYHLLGRALPTKSTALPSCYNFISRIFISGLFIMDYSYQGLFSSGPFINKTFHLQIIHLQTIHLETNKRSVWDDPYNYVFQQILFSDPLITPVTPIHFFGPFHMHTYQISYPCLKSKFLAIVTKHHHHPATWVMDL